jgi:hypothetical protein
MTFLIEKKPSLNTEKKSIPDRFIRSALQTNRYPFSRSKTFEEDAETHVTAQIPFHEALRRFNKIRIANPSYIDFRIANPEERAPPH